MSPDLCFREPVWLDHGREGYLSDHIAVRTTLEWPCGADDPRRTAAHESSPAIDP